MPTVANSQLRSLPWVGGPRSSVLYDVASMKTVTPVVFVGRRIGLKPSVSPHVRYVSSFVTYACRHFIYMFMCIPKLCLRP